MEKPSLTIVGVVVGFAVLMLKDLISFRRSQLENPDAVFDWQLGIMSWTLGAISGAGLGTGVEAMAGAQ